jgi:hypothetical protein
MGLSQYLSWSTLRQCLAKYPNGITVTELMRNEPELSFDKYTPQAIMRKLREMKSDGEVKREVKVINPRKKFILVGTTANGGTIKGKTRIERYCRFNQDDPLLVKWTPIEVGEKQVLYSLIK